MKNSATSIGGMSKNETPTGGTRKLMMFS